MNSRRTSYDVHFPYITLQLLDKIRACLSDFPSIDKASIFGMHALGNAKPTSDIDIALFGELDEKTLLNIHFLLHQKLGISRKIMTVHYETSGIVLKNHIERDGIEIYNVSESFVDPHAKKKKREVLL